MFCLSVDNVHHLDILQGLLIPTAHNVSATHDCDDNDHKEEEEEEEEEVVK